LIFGLMTKFTNKKLSLVKRVVAINYIQCW
jgi:hypothetical protein